MVLTNGYREVQKWTAFARELRLIYTPQLEITAQMHVEARTFHGTAPRS